MNKLAALLLWSTLSVCLEAQVTLGTTASTFAVLGGSTVTNTGGSVITGNLGVSPGSAIVGFPPGAVSGTIYSPGAFVLQAQVDLTAAYNTAVGLACLTNLTGQDLGGRTLTPGVYCFNSSAQLTGTLILDGQGNPNAQFIFQIGSTLTTASASAVSLTNMAQPGNVFWQIGSSATLGTNTAFMGNILALTSITFNTGATLTHGRALARNGAVTLDTNAIAIPIPAPTPTPTPTPNPTPVPTTPAPSSLTLLSIGLLGAGIYRVVIKRRRAGQS